MNIRPTLPDYAAPCGIYCKSCPALGKSCMGCRSEKPQKRISKYACRMRCCTIEKGIDFCSQCEIVPCREYKKRFITQHQHDVRYQYRRDAFTDLQILKKDGLQVWEDNQQRKWACPECGSIVWMYWYECSACHKKWFPV